MKGPFVGVGAKVVSETTLFVQGTLVMCEIGSQRGMSWRVARVRSWKTWPCCLSKELELCPLSWGGTQSDLPYVLTWAHTRDLEAT